MSSASDVSSSKGGTPLSLVGRDSPPRRHLSLFDAVAGRATHDGFAASPSAAVPPEDVLFRRQGAPDRDPARDFYWAHKDLPPSLKLPESDLLKALHAYAADYYVRTTADCGEISSRSMNETALLALGILMEESMAELLGDTGDLALVEGEPVTPDERFEETPVSVGLGLMHGNAQDSPPRHRADASHSTKKRKMDKAGD